MPSAADDSSAKRPNGTREELAHYKAQYEQLESELADFQASSRELEAELERDIEASEKRERQLKEKVESLRYEVDEWKVWTAPHIHGSGSDVDAQDYRPNASNPRPRVTRHRTRCKRRSQHYEMRTGRYN